MTPEEICRRALDRFSPELLDEQRAVYRCDCSRERVERALRSLGNEELEQMAQEQEITQVECHFCDKKYRFTREEIRKLANQK